MTMYVTESSSHLVNNHGWSDIVKASNEKLRAGTATYPNNDPLHVRRETSKEYTQQG